MFTSRLFGLFCLVVVLQGCATATKPSSQVVRQPAKSELASYHPSKVHAVVYDAPVFSGASGTRVSAQSALQAIMQILVIEKLDQKSGDTLVKKLSLEDPSIKIRERISSTLSNKLGWSDVQIEPIYAGDDHIEALKAKFIDGTLLDIKTTYWGLGVTEDYEFEYHTRGRLLDLTLSKVIWEGTCTYAELNKEFFKLISIMGNIDLASGEKLKEASVRAAEYCSDQFITQAISEK